MSSTLAERIAAHLLVLVDQVGPRPPGSPANRLATEYVASVLAAAGLAVDRRPFSARWWEPGPAELLLASGAVAIAPSPFSRSCDVRGPVVRVATPEELVRAGAPGAVLVLAGPIAADRFFPRAFPFLQLPDQLAVLAAIEASAPAAVLAVGADEHPEPVFEDPDLGFPYATVGPSVGRRLADGDEVRVRIGGRLHHGDGVNVSAPSSAPARPNAVVLSAHLDSKVSTAGALDNGGSVAALLAAVEAGIADMPGLEVVFFNGEDHYSAPGEQAWLATRDLGNVRLALNVDGAGLAGYPTSLAALAAPPELEARLDTIADGDPRFVRVPAWYESDHAIFALAGIPSVAVTSAAPLEQLRRLSHSSLDNRSTVDPAILAGVAELLLAELASLAELATSSSARA